MARVREIALCQMIILMAERTCVRWTVGRACRQAEITVQSPCSDSHVQSCTACCRCLQHAADAYSKSNSASSRSALLCKSMPGRYKHLQVCKSALACSRAELSVVCYNEQVQVPIHLPWDCMAQA